MACYRIRMKFGTDGQDFAKSVWEAGLIGIWFGSWDIYDLYAAYAGYRPKKNHEVTNAEIETYINALLRDRGLPQNMVAASVPTIKTFDELEENTWVFTYFDGRLHFGQIADVSPENEPRFDWRQEHFKAKPIKNCKSFLVSKLPDAFRLIASAGQQTLHKLKSHKKLVSILISARNEDDVLAQIRDLTLPEWIDALGDKGWESVCTAYLILEHGFLPTGLLIGGTLADFDIVGHDLHGTPLYAQCKKCPHRYIFSPEEKAVFNRLPATAKKFFFPYAGPEEWPTMDVSVISYKQMGDWFESTENGRRYRDIVRMGG
jgi:hypothetical protein